MDKLAKFNGTNNPFKIFDYKNLGSVRTVINQDGSVWFCLTDVADILDIKNSRDIIKRLERDGVDSIYTTDKIGRSQELIFVNESNLYRIIFTSRKPEAQDFQNWVFNSVIPSVRRTGSYDIENDNTLTPTTKAIVAHDRMLSAHSKILYTHSKEIKNMKTRQNEIENRQVSLIEEGYHAILRFAQYYGIETTERDRQILGKKATAICNLRGIPMGQEPAGRFIANTYPYPVLVEVFQEFVSDNNN